MAGLSWNYPTGSEVFSGKTITLNASANSSSVKFYRDGSAIQSGTNVSTKTGGYYTLDWDTDNAGTGTFDLTVSNGTLNKTVQPAADFKSPSISSKSPSGPTGETAPTVSYSASDSPAGVNSSTAYINVTAPDGSSVGAANSTSVSVSGLSGGKTYTVHYQIEDKVGNKAANNWTFTVDTTADFTLGLSSGDFDPEPGTVLMDGNEDVEVTLSDVNEDGTASCLDSGGDEISSGRVSSSDSTFTCTFDENTYSGSTVDVEVKVCDDVNNCKTSDSSFEFGFDASPPTLVDLSTASGASSFNDDFNISFSATDDVSSIETVEYYFDSSVDFGEGTEIGYESGRSTYSVDASSLDRGEHTLYVRAKDSQGRWSKESSLSFSFYPDRTPTVSLSVPGNVSVTAGDSRSFTVDVTNTGKVFVPGLTVEASSKVFSASSEVAGMAPDESKSVTFDVSTSEEDIGRYTVSVSTSDPSASKSFGLVVRANQQQRQEINSTFREYRQKLEALRENVTSLKKKGLNQQRNRRLESNFSAFEQKVQAAEAAVEKGAYYRAEEILANIDQKYSSAKKTYSQVKKAHRKAQTRQLILMVFLGVVVLVSTGVGYIAYSDRYDLDLQAVEARVEAVANVDMDVDVEGGSTLENFKQKLSGLFDTGSEAEDYSWEGFKDE
ncbi:MAG: Ig-like domain-containing protein [Candidatus Nanohaloarchaea archaeon]